MIYAVYYIHPVASS